MARFAYLIDAEKRFFRRFHFSIFCPSFSARFFFPLSFFRFCCCETYSRNCSEKFGFIKSSRARREENKLKNKTSHWSFIGLLSNLIYSAIERGIRRFRPADFHAPRIKRRLLRVNRRDHIFTEVFATTSRTLYEEWSKATSVERSRTIL